MDGDAVGDDETGGDVSGGEDTGGDDDAATRVGAGAGPAAGSRNC